MDKAIRVIKALLDTKPPCTCHVDYKNLGHVGPWCAQCMWWDDEVEAMAIDLIEEHEDNNYE